MLTVLETALEVGVKLIYTERANNFNLPITSGVHLVPRLTLLLVEILKFHAFLCKTTLHREMPHKESEPPVSSQVFHSR